MISNYPPPRDSDQPRIFRETITLADGLLMPNGAANGSVLVSDGAGRGSWSLPAAANLKQRGVLDYFTGFPQVFRMAFGGATKGLLYVLDEDTQNVIEVAVEVPTVAAADITLRDPGANVSVPYSAYLSGTAGEGKTAAIAKYTAWTTTRAGLYRISAYTVAKVVTVAGTLTARAYYVDRWGAQGPDTLCANAIAAAGNHAQATVVAYCTAGSIIEFDTTVGLFTGTYDAYFTVELI